MQAKRSALETSKLSRALFYLKPANLFYILNNDVFKICAPIIKREAFDAVLATRVRHLYPGLCFLDNSDFLSLKACSHRYHSSLLPAALTNPSARASRKLKKTLHRLAYLRRPIPQMPRPVDGFHFWGAVRSTPKVKR